MSLNLDKKWRSSRFEELNVALNYPESLIHIYSTTTVTYPYSFVRTKPIWITEGGLHEGFTVRSLIGPGKSPKINLPEIFDGSSEKINLFIVNCKLYMTIKEDTFENEMQKKAFILSHIRGPIINDWVIYQTERMLDSSDSLENATQLLQYVKEQFGDVDEQITSQQKLDVLKQETTAADYVVKFRTLARKTGYNDVALVAAFRKGINSKILTKIFGFEKMPKSLEEWFKTSIKLDRQNRDCQAVLAGQKTEKTEKESFSYSDPPIISSKPRMALTPTQDQNQKLVCSYCRKEGHRN